MSHTNTDEKKRIPLGSGRVYVVPYTEVFPADEIIETEMNRLGDVQGGASVEYKPTFYTATDDLKRVSKTILTDEEASLKLGLITWNTNVLNKLVANGKVTEADGKRTIRIGGLENQKIQKYLFRFLIKDPVDGDIRISIAGSNQAGLSLTFAKDKESTINPEIKAEPMEDGTLIVYEEEVLTAYTYTEAEIVEFAYGVTYYTRSGDYESYVYTEVAEGAEFNDDTTYYVRNEG